MLQQKSRMPLAGLVYFLVKMLYLKLILSPKIQSKIIIFIVYFPYINSFKSIRAPATKVRQNLSIVAKNENSTEHFGPVNIVHEKYTL